jgi:hypothetical protein
MGPVVCSGTGAALAPASQADQRLVAGGRDVRAGERRMGILYGAVDFSGATIDFLLSAKREAATAQRFLTKALGWREPSGAAGHQQRQARRLSISHGRAPSRRRSGRPLPTPPRAVSQ